MSERPATNLKKAIPLVILAALFNTVMIVFVKLAAQNVSVPVILFARYLITLLIILPFVYFNPPRQPIRVFLKTNRPGLHLLRDICGLISVFSYFYAAKHISLADATVLFTTAPLFIPIIAYFWGGLKIIKRLWWGMGLGFVGVVLILHPGKELFHPTLLIGLLSGLSAGIVYVGSRYLSYSEPHLRNMFYYFAIGTAIALVISFPSLSTLKVLNKESLLLLLGVGIFGYLYQLCFTVSTRHAPVRLTTSFLYTSVIFSLIIDFIFWQIVPSPSSLMGIGLIIIGACLLVLLYPKENDQHKNNISQKILAHQ